MKRKELTVLLDANGVDNASETIQSWLEEVSVDHTDILRIRLMAEELLDDIRRHYEQPMEAKLLLRRLSGAIYLMICYGGERFDPTQQDDNASEIGALLLSQLGLQPSWRWRNRENELILRISGRRMSSEQLMLVCIALAAAVGLAGPLIPSGVREVITDYGLSFLSSGFLNLLNTFIGLMVFLSVVTGICGIGDASVLGKLGKSMMSRYAGVTFALCALFTAAAFFCFPIPFGTSGSGSQIHSIFELVFGILPSNPIRPFLEGNTLQIVFLAVMVGSILLISGSQSEHLRKLITEIHGVVMRCVSAVCVFLPVYIFSSLVSQLWTEGAGLFIRFGKPLLLSIVLSLLAMVLYLVLACMKLKVKPGVLAPKLLPDFLIGLSTASSAAALPTSIEINEKKLGIDASFARMASPIGTILFAGTASLIFVMSGAFLATHFGITVNPGWWITLWIVSSLLAMSQPPVAGGVISCLTVLLSQMGIPQEGLSLAIALAMVMDFFTTASRIFLLHLEIAMQAEDMKLLNHEILEQK